MKQTITFLGIIAIASVLFLACNPGNAETQNTTEETPELAKAHIESEIRAANDQLYAGLNAMFAGDLEPLKNLWSHGEHITYMGPFGGQLVGWDAIHADFAKVADMKIGGKIICQDLQVYAGQGMGYTICVEAGENIGPDGQPVKVSHRATNIFQLEDGEWRLIHHHTDLSPQLEHAFPEEMEE